MAINVSMAPAAPAETERRESFTIERLREAQSILERYQSGKANLDNKLIESEDWWKLAHFRDYKTVRYVRGEDGKVAIVSDHPNMPRQSSWMFNSIMGKHADVMDNFPDPLIVARSEDDASTAEMLSSVLPVILQNCGFEQVYSDNSWDKLILGTSCYAVLWNPDLENGVGDIEIKPVDLLSMYWEPGVQELQDSRYLFILSLEDKDLLEERYPQTRDKLTGSVMIEKHYRYDDDVDLANKAVVVDMYYKVKLGSRTILHYAKWVDDIVLYCSEDDPMYASTGFYSHGMYPYVLDPLYREKGTPAGFGFVDVMREAQDTIDHLSADFKRNAEWGSKPRFFSKDEGAVNVQEFRNLDQEIVHVAGSIDENHLKPIETKGLDGAYLNFYQLKIDELKETSGNRDFNQGSPASGVTSGAAIAALQEAGNKGSRDIIRGTYRSFVSVCTLVIELIRQFYTAPRTFRITGTDGMPQYVEFDNTGMQSQAIMLMGQEFQSKEPVFDINVRAQKANPYSRLSQNELAFSLYDRGMFNPQMADQALIALDLMDFEGKDKVVDAIRQNQRTQQIMMQMAQMLGELTGDTRIADALMAQGGMPAAGGGAGLSPLDAAGEPIATNTPSGKSRARAAESTEVDR